MSTQPERAELIARIRSLPDEMEAAVRDLDARQLDTPYRDGGWTVRQVVHHVADSHMNAYIRMKLILTEEHPTLKPYDQDRWAELIDTAEVPVEASLAILDGLHSRWSDLLEHLPEESWSRSAFHPENGEVTLDGILRTYAGHGAHHVGQITKLRAERGW
jgi:uncharacterized damage-inducible protein DinB